MSRVICKGVVTTIDYYHFDRTLDSVGVRLSADSAEHHAKAGELVSVYRFQVEETGPQECVEESWRRTALPGGGS